MKSTQKNKTVKSGLYLFKLAGFEVRLDWSWFFLAILIVWTLASGYFPFNFPGLSTNTYWLMGIIGAIGLFLSIIFHELCHSLVGRYYGIPIAGITLFIFGGIAEMRDTPRSPKAEFLMAFIGPLFSLALSALCYFLFWIGTHAGWPIPVMGVIRYLAIINLIVGIFNLLPGFPLDGGRIFRSILWWLKGDLKWATGIACKGGAFLGITMIIFGVLLFMQGAFISGLWMFLLGFFLQHIAKMSYQELIIRETFGTEAIKKYVTTDPITVDPHISIQEFIENYFYHHYHKLYPVLDNGNLVGCILLNDVKALEKSKWSTLTVENVMRECTADIVIDAETPVLKALQTMTNQKLGRLIVTDHGKLYGIITLKDLMDVIAIRTSFGY